MTGMKGSSADRGVKGVNVSGGKRPGVVDMVDVSVLSMGRNAQMQDEAVGSEEIYLGHLKAYCPWSLFVSGR